MKYDVAFISVVPSPYQRDLFRALAKHPEINLRVFYLEAAAWDSPWPEKPLASYEAVLPGFWIGRGAIRCHLNWRLPDVYRYDVVVLNSLMTLTAQWLIRVKLRRQPPWVFWGERLRSREAGWKKTLQNALVAPLQNAAAIAGIGSHAVQDYARRFSKPKHFCIPYYTELRPFLKEPRAEKLKPNEVTFLFCGQMIARKGLDILLEAFCKLAEKFGRQVRLLLVGREAELPAMLQHLPEAVRKQIHYAGFQSPERLPEFFAQADVFVLPSRYDGWGVVVNQALGAGLPVICSDAVGAGHDLVDDEKNGLKFPSGSAPALEYAMTRFAEQPELAAKFGAASREKAAEWHPENGAAKWVEVFKSLLETT